MSSAGSSQGLGGEEQKRTVYVSRRGSITIQQGGNMENFSQFYTSGQDESLGHPIRASDSQTLDIDQLAQSKTSETYHRRGAAPQPTTTDSAEGSHEPWQRYASQTTQANMPIRLNKSTPINSQLSWQQQKYQSEHQSQRFPMQVAAGLSPTSRRVVDSVYTQVDRSLDSMRSKQSMSIESALRHMRSRLPINLDKLGEVAYDRLVEYINMARKREKEEKEESSEKEVLVRSFKKIVKELEDLSQQNKQLREMLNHECEHSSKISMRLNEALDQVDQKWSGKEENGEKNARDSLDSDVSNEEDPKDQKRKRELAELEASSRAA